MKKIISLILLLASLVLNASAQKLTYGAHVGINFSGYYGGDQYRVYNEQVKTGYEAGGDVSYHLGSNFMLLSGLNFAQSGGKFSTMSPYISTTGKQITEFEEVNTKILSFEMPVKIGYDIKLGNSFSVIPNVGMFARYTVASIKSNVITADGRARKWKGTDDFNEDSHHLEAFNKFDYGIVCGIDLLFLNHYSLSASYKHGLKKVQPQFGMKSWSADVSVGYRF